MAELLNAAGETHYVPDNQVEAYVKSGQWGFPKGGQVRVVNSEGTPVAIPSERAFDAFSAGTHRYLTGPEREKIARGKAFTGGPGDAASAYTAAVLRGLTFGGSDVAITQLGGVPGEALEQQRTGTPGTTAVELGAAILPAVLSGGTGALAKGAAMAPTAIVARAAGKVGEKAAGAAAKRFLSKEAAAQLLAREALPVAAREAVKLPFKTRLVTALAKSAASGAAETPVYAAGQLATETALGNEDLTAQKIVSHLGLSTILGGAIGGGLAGAGVAGGEVASRMAQKAKDLLNTYTKAQAASASEAGAQAVAGLSARLAGVDESIARKFTAGPFTKEGAEMRSFIRSGRTYKDETAREFTKNLKSHYDDMRSALSEAEARGKPEQLERLMAEEAIDGSIVKAAAQDELDTIASRLKSLKKDNVRFGDQGAVAEMSDIVAKMTKEIRHSSKPFTVFDRMQEAKRLMSGLARHGEDFRGKDRAFVNTALEMRDIYDKLKTHLEDSNLYGSAGATQSAFNEVGASARRAMQEFEDVFFVKRRGKLKMDPRKIHTALNKKTLSPLSTLGEVRSDMHEEALEKWLTESSRLTDEIDALYQGVERNPVNIKGIKTSLANTRAAKEVLNKEAAVVRDYQLLKEQTQLGGVSNMEVGAGVAAAGMFGIPMALPFVGAARVMRSPVNVINHLALLERLAARAEGATNAAIRAIVKGKEIGAGVIRRSAPIQQKGIESLIHSDLDTTNSKKSRPQDSREAYNRIKSSLTKISANAAPSPSDRVTRNLGSLSVAAPKVTAGAANVAQRGALFLLSKLPQNPIESDSMTKAAARWEPNDAQMSEFAAYVRAVDDPVSVLEDLSSGDISPEAIEAVTAVYPDLVESWGEKIEQQLEDEEEDLPYQKRAALSMFLGRALDPTFEPEFMKKMQAPYAQAPQAQPPQAPPRGSANIKSVEATASAMDKLAV